MGMTLAFVVAQVGLSVIPPDPSTADDPSAAVRTCIATNAPSVERAIESLNEGTDFLAQKVCGGAILDQMMEANRKRSEEQKAKIDAACKDKDATAKDSSSGFDMRQSPWLNQMCDPNASMFYDSAMSDVSTYMLQTNGGSAKATSLAAQTLLQLRIARTKPR